MEAHAPYQSPDEYQYKYIDDPEVFGWDDSQAKYFDQTVSNQEKQMSDLRDQYDGCIRYLDRQIKHLIEILKEHSVFEDSLVIITSDHGEAFGEKGLYEHKIGVYDELAHVPLFINPPTDDTRTIETPVSNQWLFSTILQAAGVDVPTHASNNNLIEPSTSPILIESEAFPYNSENTIPDSLRKYRLPHQGYIDMIENMKLIRYETDNRPELYHLGDESTDITADNQETVERLVSGLEKLLEDAQKTPRSDANETFEVDEQTQEHLRNLGYR
jgi:arylsulfatase A-like enzyme